MVHSKRLSKADVGWRNQDGDLKFPEEWAVHRSDPRTQLVVHAFKAGYN